jgi:hypothetical protein
MDVLLLDMGRFAVMFLLGAAVSMEIAAARYAHIGIFTPNGNLYHVPMVALLLLALSRILCLFFVAGVIHENFGEPLRWYTPMGLLIATCSIAASSVVARKRVL